jgi:hypothetical protein
MWNYDFWNNVDLLEESSKRDAYKVRNSARYNRKLR